MTRLRRLPRLLLIMLLLVGWRRCAIEGTNARFTARTTAAGNVFRAGTVQLASTPAAGATLFPVPVLLPGESVEAPVTIRNTGTLGFSYTLRVAAGAASALAEDSAHGLQLEVTRCVTGPWVAPYPDARTYVCAGETPAVGSAGSTEVIYRGPILRRAAPGTGTPEGAGDPILIGPPLAAGGAHALKLRVSLPESALGAGLIGQSVVLGLLWQAEVAATPLAVAAPTPAQPPR